MGGGVSFHSLFSEAKETRQTAAASEGSGCELLREALSSSPPPEAHVCPLHLSSSLKSTAGGVVRNVSRRPSLLLFVVLLFYYKKKEKNIHSTKPTLEITKRIAIRLRKPSMQVGPSAWLRPAHMIKDQVIKNIDGISLNRL